MKHYFTLQRFTVTKTKTWHWENGTFPILLVGPHVGTVGGHLTKSGNATYGLPFGQAIPLSGIKSGKTSTHLHKETCTRILEYCDALKLRNRRTDRLQHIHRT